MKAQQNDNPSYLTEFKQIYCSQGNLSTLICSNNNCHENAFVCQNKKCLCKKKHQMCLQTKTQSVLDILTKKSFSIKPFIDQVEEIFDKLIDQISDIRDQILLRFKQNSELFGLTPIELTFYQAIKAGETKQIQCTHMTQIFSKIHDSDKSMEKRQNIEKNISKILSDCKKQISKFQKYLNKYSKQANLPSINWFQNSKIVKQNEDQTNLIKFFNKEINSANLLYRASQNSFKIQKFHQKCDGIPHTLLLIETQFGKILGGYTPLVWGSDTTGQVEDELGESFIFSLSHNDKLVHDKQKSAIYRSRGYGPVFGWNSGNPDIYLVNDSDKTPSFTDICWAYSNPNYKYRQPQSWERFNGNLVNQWFKIKQWEVWKLQFDE